MEGPLIIVGYMGSGKSTVGRLAARDLGWDFLDLDREISQRASLSIPEIFARHGEAFFRDLEHETLLKALGGPLDRIIACGGGIVTRPDNREALRNVATVFLREDPRLLFERTRGDDRPLRGRSFEPFVQRYNERLPLYEEVSDRTIYVRGRPARHVAGEVLRWLSE